MKDCKGIFGKWFGHKFASLIVEYIPPERPLPDIGGCDISRVNESIAHKKYKIICKRCGTQK